MLSEEEVLHVAQLARIKLSNDEIDNYRKNLKIMIDEIDKIKQIDVIDEETMYTPVEKIISLREDKVEEMLNISDVMRNVPHKNGDFIEVPVMINE